MLTTRSRRASSSPTWSKSLETQLPRLFPRQYSVARSGSRHSTFAQRGDALARLARNYVAGFKISAPADMYLKRAIGTSL